jgi:hypothetical protein
MCAAVAQCAARGEDGSLSLAPRAGDPWLPRAGAYDEHNAFVCVCVSVCVCVLVRWALDADFGRGNICQPSSNHQFNHPINHPINHGDNTHSSPRPARSTQPRRSRARSRALSSSGSRTPSSCTSSRSARSRPRAPSLRTASATRSVRAAWRPLWCRAIALRGRAHRDCSSHCAKPAHSCSCLPEDSRAPGETRWRKRSVCAASGLALADSTHGGCSARRVRGSLASRARGEVLCSLVSELCSPSHLPCPSHARPMRRATRGCEQAQCCWAENRP